MSDVTVAMPMSRRGRRSEQGGWRPAWQAVDRAAYRRTRAGTSLVPMRP